MHRVPSGVSNNVEESLNECVVPCAILCFLKASIRRYVFFDSSFLVCECKELAQYGEQTDGLTLGKPLSETVLSSVVDSCLKPAWTT